MKYAFVILISVVLIFAEGCTVGEKPDADKKDNAGINPEVQAMVNARKWVEEGLQLLDVHMSHTDEKGLPFKMLELAKLQALTGDREGARATFERITKHLTAQGKLNYWKHPLAHYEVMAGLHDMAMETVKDFVGRDRGTWYNIVVYESRAGFYDNAMRTAECVNADKEEGYLIVAYTAATAGDYAKAKEAAAHLQAQKTAALMYIAIHEQKSGDSEAAKETFRLAEQAAETIKDKSPYLTIVVADLKATLGDKAGARECLDKARVSLYGLAGMDVMSECLCEIAVVEAKAIGKDAALKTFQEAGEIANKSKQSQHWWEKIIEYKVKAGFYAEAKADVGKLRVDYSITKAVEKIALAEIEAGLHKQATETVNLIKSMRNRQDSLSKIAMAQIRAGALEEAAKIIYALDWRFADPEPLLLALGNAEIAAGDTRHLEERISALTKENSGLPSKEVFELLARSGQDDRLTKLYEESKSRRSEKSTEVLQNCIAIIQGYLNRAQDLKRAADAAGRDER